MCRHNDKAVQRILTTGFLQKKIFPCLIEIAPGGKTTLSPAKPDVEQCCDMVSGRVRCFDPSTCPFGTRYGFSPAVPHSAVRCNRLLGAQRRHRDLGIRRRTAPYDIDEVFPPTPTAPDCASV
ncbi:MAG: hypothetical protein Q8R91_01155 [Candidatus Omnitrophota bacterium]|nr:hypothetical protein [Candidatus Omnitrophota bacterium]